MREDGAAEGPKRPDGVNDKPPKAERRRRVSVKSPRESRRFPEHLLRAGHRAKCRGHAATYVASFPLGKSAAGHGVTAVPRSLPRTGLQTLPAAQRISGRTAGSSARWKAFPDDSPVFLSAPPLAVSRPREFWCGLSAPSAHRALSPSA